MNERILEKLYKQSLIETEGDGFPDIEMDVKKFAELIVKECAKVAYEYASDSENYDHYEDIGWDCLPSDLKSHIKEHFGVEE
jgi:hypothetical protein